MSKINSSALHLLADLLVALWSDEHLDTGLVYVINVGPVSLDLRVFNPTGQTIDGTCRPVDHKHRGSREEYC